MAVANTREKQFKEGTLILAHGLSRVCWLPYLLALVRHNSMVEEWRGTKVLPSEHREVGSWRMPGWLPQFSMFSPSGPQPKMVLHTSGKTLNSQFLFPS
jgi:hypothetical protein